MNLNPLVQVSRPKTGNIVAKRLAHGSKGGIVALVVLILVAPAAAGKKRVTRPQASTTTYAFALAGANRFLHAWQSGDLEAGMAMLSDRARHGQDPDKFEEYFAVATDRAFEITQATASGARYRFSVVLVTVEGNRVRRRFSEIIMTNTGKNDWAVDKLP